MKDNDRIVKLFIIFGNEDKNLENNIKKEMEELNKHFYTFNINIKTIEIDLHSAKESQTFTEHNVSKNDILLPIITENLKGKDEEENKEIANRLKAIIDVAKTKKMRICPFLMIDIYMANAYEILLWETDLIVSNGENEKIDELSENIKQLIEDDLNGNSSKLDLAISYDILANNCDNEGDFDNALIQYQKSLEIYESIYNKNPNNMKLVKCYSNVGTAYSNLNDDDSALYYHIKALGICGNLYIKNPNHYNLLYCYHIMLSIYTDIVDFMKVSDYYQKKMGVLKTNLKEVSICYELAVCYHSIGVYYLQNNNKEKAKEFLEKAEKLCPEIDKEKDRTISSKISRNNK